MARAGGQVRAKTSFVLAGVLRRVGLGGLGVVVLGLDVMAIGEMGVMRRLLVVSGGVVLVRLVVVLGGVLVVRGRVLMVLGDVVLAHGSLPKTAAGFGDAQPA